MRQQHNPQGLGLRWMLLALMMIVTTMYLSNVEQSAWERQHVMEAGHEQ